MTEPQPSPASATSDAGPKPRRRPRWWFKLAALLVPALALFVAAEVIVRARYDVVAPQPYAWPGNMATAPAPLLWRNAPAYQGTWFQETERLALSHNEQGMRDPPLTEARKATKRRVLFVGDSITYGRGVADGEPFATLLEPIWTARAGEPVATFNAGVSGYDTHQESATLRGTPATPSAGELIDPQVVIVGWYRNDVQVPSTTVSVSIIEGQFAQDQEAYERWKARYIDHSNPLDWSALLRLGRLWWKDFKLRRWSLEERAHRVGKENQGGGEDDGDAGEGAVNEAAAMLATQQALRDMKAWCDARGAKLAVVLFPAREEVEASHEMAHPPHLAAMAAQCAKDGIPCLDLFEPWRVWARAHRGETLYIHRDRCHPNKAGHAQVALWIDEAFGALVTGR